MVAATPTNAQDETEPQPARIHSIDPEYPDSADLAPIIEAIGDRRIVVLAERTPGDGASLLAKTRLCRELMRSHGFTVIAFEAGLYDSRSMNTQFAAGTDYHLCAALGLPDQWAGSGYMLELYHDIWDSYFTRNPVDVCGLDNRITGRRTARQLPREVLDYLGSIDPHPFDKDQRRHMLTVIERLDEAIKADDDAGVVQSWEDLHKLRNALKANESALVEARGAQEFAIWQRIIDDQITNAEDEMSFDVERSGLSDDNLRQELMAERLSWFANEVYPDRKFIVWCSAVTAVTDASDVRLDRDPALIADYVSAGAGWRRQFGDQIFTITFDAGGGDSAFIRGMSLPSPKAPPGSFEDLLDVVDWPFLFVRLGNQAPEWAQSRLSGNLLGLNPQLAADDRLPNEQKVTASWSRQFDAVFYISTMFPNYFDSRPPQGALHTVHTE